jgi:fructose-1,6-bisphosphatase/inositol monophosphatase family enzyme
LALGDTFLTDTPIVDETANTEWMVVSLSPVDVSAVVANVAQREVMTRFHRLRLGDVWEKSPGDIVTAADVAVERRLAIELTELLPGSNFVGEEGVGADAGELALLSGDRPVWIVDPLDGTSNFVRGNERFCIMVALAWRNCLIASWLCAPAVGLTGMAWAGRGAVVNGRRTVVMRARHRPLRVVVTDPAYRSDDDRAQISRLQREEVVLRACSGVGVVYLEIALGKHDAAVFGWTKVWDHAAGLLLHAETGGWATTGNGSPFRVAALNQPPLVLAPSAESGDWLRRIVGAPDDPPPATE